MAVDYYPLDALPRQWCGYDVTGYHIALESPVATIRWLDQFGVDGLELALAALCERQRTAHPHEWVVLCAEFAAGRRWHRFIYQPPDGMALTEAVQARQGGWVG